MLVEGIAVVGKVGFSVELIYTVDVDGFKVEVIVVGAAVVVVARKLNKFIKFKDFLKKVTHSLWVELST